MTTIIFGIFEEGLVYAIMALGVYITYKILDFPDLSVDGVSFDLGEGFHRSSARGASRRCAAQLFRRAIPLREPAGHGTFDYGPAGQKRR